MTAPVATRLIQSVGVLQTFAYLGIAFLIVTVAGGYFMQNPPVGWKPTGWTPRSSQASQPSSRDYTLGEALRTWQWWALWLLLFLNTSAGISVISQESPLFQELARVSAAAAAGMVGLASIGNALGRVFWAWASDSITRRATFAVMFLGQAVLFWSLPSVNSAAVLTLVTFVILYVLRGRIRHYAGVRCRLLWLKKCGPNLRTHANCMGLCERIWPAADCLYAPGERNVWRTPPCDRRSDGSFRHASVDSIPTPPDRGSSQVYSTSTAPGNVNLVCASLTNLAARLPTCGFPSPTAATTSVCTAAAEMRVRFTETCLFPIPAHSSALRQCGNQEGPDYRWGATVAQGRHRVRTGVVAAAHCG